MKQTKILYCKKCGRNTEHLFVGFRRPFEKQRYRCQVCKTEVSK